MNAIAKYFRELTTAFGNGWNRFWFTPVDPFGVCLLRVLTGVMALWFVISFTPDLITWFGPNGLLPIESVQQLTADREALWNGRASYLYYVDEPALLWAVHVAGILVVAAFTLGLATRITNVLALVIVLSYIHRAPMVTAQFEPVLSFMLFYLCLSPCGQALSLDSWLKRNRAPENPPHQRAHAALSLSANISQRLMQIHVAALYLMMGLTKLGGSDAWWAGEAMWWLIAHTESRLVNLTFLHRWDFLLNVWTLAVVSFELLFGILIWNRLARPLLLGLAIVHWLLLGLITGLLSFALMMLVANLAFVSPEVLRQFVTGFIARGRSHESAVQVGIQA